MDNQTDSQSLLRLLGIRTPIIQAPMAGVSTPALAAAVSNAGGLGSLGIGAASVDGARKMIQATRELTDKPFNVNVFCHPPAAANTETERAWLNWLEPVFAQYGAAPPTALAEIYTSFVVDQPMQQMLLEEKPAVVSFHFGLPAVDVIADLKRSGIVLLANVTSLGEANQAAAAGVHAVIAQGIEAGGHRGAFDPSKDDHLGTFALVRLLAKHIKLPVIAAGGIMDGAGIVAALALGAQAAQLGTAFVACKETAIDEGYRRALLSDAARETTLTSAISGRSARALKNRFTALGEASSALQVPDYPRTYDAGKALHALAKSHGEFGYGAQWAGQAAMLARELPAVDLFAKLVQEMQEAIEAMKKW